MCRIFRLNLLEEKLTLVPFYESKIKEVLKSKNPVDFEIVVKTIDSLKLWKRFNFEQIADISKKINAEGLLI